MKHLLRLAQVLIVAVFVVLAALHYGCGLRYSPTPSLDARCFLALRRPVTLHDYVAFCAPPEASETLLRLGYRPSRRHCSGQLVELVKRVAVIRDGQAIVLGDHKDSFDSRYFGPLPVEDLTPLRRLF